MNAEKHGVVSMCAQMQSSMAEMAFNHEEWQPCIDHTKEADLYYKKHRAQWTRRLAEMCAYRARAFPKLRHLDKAIACAFEAREPTMGNICRECLV